MPAVAAHAAVPVRLNLQGLGRHPAPIETALYYCCTEALQNAAKHGGPDTTATITAHADDRMLTLTISDTGRGFDPATTGTGLTNMTDRLAAIGGQLVIDSAPGSSTRITATVTTAVQPYGNALDTEMTEHLGYGTHDPIGRGSDNPRNGQPGNTVITAIRPVDIEDATQHQERFEPQVVNEHQRRLSGIDEMLLALPAKGLTTREVAVDFADVYDYLGARRARRCRQTRRRTQIRLRS